MCCGSRGDQAVATPARRSGRPTRAARVRAAVMAYFVVWLEWLAIWATARRTGRKIIQL